MAEPHHAYHPDHHHRSRRRRRLAIVAVLTAILFVAGYTAIIYWFTESEPVELQQQAHAATHLYLLPR
jgi:hypothetical protein